jgi:hypothetical protein
MDDGWIVTDVSQWLLVLSRRFHTQSFLPDRNVVETKTIALVEVPPRSVRMMVTEALVTNPGSVFERATPLS